jgi:hypothetical protein
MEVVAEPAPEESVTLAEEAMAEVEPTAVRAESASAARRVAQRSRGVSGVVVSADGDRAAGATVIVERISREGYAPYERQRVRADDGGFFHVPGINSYGGYVVLATTEAESGAALISVDNRTIHSPASLLIQLEPSHQLSGTVVDAAGKPVPNAEVGLSALASYAFKDPYGGLSWNDDGVILTPLPESRPPDRYVRVRGPLVARTDAAGRFNLSALPVGECRVTVTAKGFAPTQSEWADTHAEGVRITLARGSRLEGRVHMADSGAPVARARVMAVDATAGRELAAVADAAGRFALEDLAPGTYHLRPDSGDLVAQSTDPVMAVVEAGKDVLDIELQVAKGGVISGRVLDNTTGAPVPRVQVQVTRNDDRTRRAIAAHTDGAGAYRFTSLEPGEYNVRPFLNQKSWLGGLTIALKLGETISDVKLRMPPARTLRGRVQLADGTGVPGVTVVIGNDLFALSGTNGSFELLGLDPNESYTLVAHREALVAPPVGPVNLTAESLDPVVLTLEPGCAFGGRLISKHGEPPRMAMIELKSKSTGLYRRENVDRSGSFLVEGLLAGEYWMTCTVRPFGYFREEVTFVPGERRTDWALTYEQNMFSEDGRMGMIPVPHTHKREGTQSLSGRVVDAATGEGIYQVEVSVRGQLRKTFTDGTGSFVFENLPEFVADLKIWKRGYALAESVPVQTGATDVVIELSRYGDLSGQVFSHRTGDPITAFGVGCYTEPKDQTLESIYGRDSLTQVRDAEGRFTLPQVLRDEPMYLLVVAKGHRAELVAVPASSDGQSVGPLEVRLHEGRRLRGRVVDASGKGIPAVQIHLGVPKPPDERDRVYYNYSLGARTQPDGQFEADDVRPNVTQIRAMHDRFFSTDALLPPGNGRLRDVTLVMESGGVVEGYVTDLGQPVAGVRLRATARRGQGTTQTNADGYYRLTGVRNGRARLLLHIENGDQRRTISKECEVAEGMVTRLDFALEGDNAENLSATSGF